MSKVFSIADIEALPGMRTKEVDIPEWKGSFVVRELSRDEMHRGKECEDGAEFERWCLETAVVEPPLTPALIDKIMRSEGAIAIVDRITEAIAELSGMGSGAQKSAEKSFRTEPGEGV